MPCGYVTGRIGKIRENFDCRMPYLHICVRPLQVARSTNRAMSEPQTVGRVTSTDSHAFVFKTNLPESGESIGHDGTIMKQNKNEELQSRREFFKKAAKVALPIIGGIALMSTPLTTMASETSWGCNWGCESGCSGGCEGCAGACKGGCSGSCETGCYGGCKTTCTANCKSVSNFR